MRMLAVSLFFLLFTSSNSYAYDRTKYDAWERGTIDVIDRWAADATEKYKKMWSRWQIVAGHRKQGANHDHIDELTSLHLSRSMYHRWNHESIQNLGNCHICKVK